ncbi:MAG: hypothetical protein KZQ77_15060 [Candidatus Thiodiazotropha sp. (ex Notomyrtea botanica)]|nr:hypothetical protein [Candidatus Thiodiazotropha sp. (ex Notomyrtea botanica)]
MATSLDKEIAEKLINSLQRCRDELDATEIISREIEDEELRLKFKKTIGRVSLDLYTQGMGQVFQFYPDLDPLGIFDPKQDHWEKKQ